MERPSHLLADTHVSFGRRTLLLGVALGLQVAGAWLFTQGLARSVVDIIREIEVPPILEVQKPRTPPPIDPVLTHIETPTVPMPTFDVGAAREGAGGITATTGDAQNSDTQGTQVASLVIKPPVSIAGTHTVPPYPPIARRLGVEGTVTLRLTVTAEGRVAAAEVVTSAGRSDMDEAARDWIVSHWRYRPALKDGTPAPSQTMASVSFSLKD